jgi:hypothetical protein
MQNKIYQGELVRIKSLTSESTFFKEGKGINCFNKC